MLPISRKFARFPCVVACTASAWRGARVSGLYLFSKNQIGFQRTKRRFRETNRAGRFVRSVLMVGLFGRPSQGLLRDENEYDWWAAAEVIESGNVRSLFYA